jgi:hypothetical protein
MLKAGDRVICVDNREVEEGLTIGCIYEVIKLDAGSCIHVIDDTYNVYGYYRNRFKKVSAHHLEGHYESIESSCRCNAR